MTVDFDTLADEYAGVVHGLRVDLGEVLTERDRLAAVNRALAAEVRALQALVRVADAWAAGAERIRRHLHLEQDEQTLRINHYMACSRADLGHRMTEVRRWIAAQGPDGPRATYPVDPRTWQLGPPQPPELREAAHAAAGGEGGGE